MIENMEELKEHLESRFLMVAESNELLENLCCQLNNLQRRVLAYLIARIGPKDSGDASYEIDLDEILALLRWTELRYTSIREAIKKLEKVRWKIRGKRDIYTGFVDCKDVAYSRRLLRIQFKSDVVRHLYYLKLGSRENPATIYQLQFVLPLQHRYSVRLYELMCSHANLDEWVYEFGTGSHKDLKPLLAPIDEKTGRTAQPACWDRWAHFRDKVLEPSIKEINEFTDLQVSYEGFFCDQLNRRTNVVRSIRFRIKKRKGHDKLAVLERINGLYAAYIKEWADRFETMERPVHPLLEDKKDEKAQKKPEAAPCIRAVPEQETDDWHDGGDEYYADPKETERAYREVLRQMSRSGKREEPKSPPPPSYTMYSPEEDEAIFGECMDNLPF